MIHDNININTFLRAFKIKQFVKGTFYSKICNMSFAQSNYSHACFVNEYLTNHETNNTVGCNERKIIYVEKNVHSNQMGQHRK